MWYEEGSVGSIDRSASGASIHPFVYHNPNIYTQPTQIPRQEAPGAAFGQRSDPALHAPNRAHVGAAARRPRLAGTGCVCVYVCMYMWLVYVLDWMKERWVRGCYGSFELRPMRPALGMDRQGTRRQRGQGQQGGGGRGGGDCGGGGDVGGVADGAVGLQVGALSAWLVFTNGRGRSDGTIRLTD